MKHLILSGYSICFELVLLLGQLAVHPALAGSEQDKALRDASGCQPDLGIDVAAVKAALKAGADPNASSKERWLTMGTPLSCMNVVLNSHLPDSNVNYKALEVAKVLFAAGAKLGPVDIGILSGPIHAGNMELVRLLIEKGASPKAKLGNFTPAELARKYERTAIYEYLLSRGAAPVDELTAAQQVLIEGARKGDVVKMKQALQAGAFINFPDLDGDTALDVALDRPNFGRPWAVPIWWLLDNGADPNLGDRLPPLHKFILVGANELRNSVSRQDDPAVKEREMETLARLLRVC